MNNHPPLPAYLGQRLVEQFRLTGHPLQQAAARLLADKRVTAFYGDRQDIRALGAVLQDPDHLIVDLEDAAFAAVRHILQVHPAICWADAKPHLLARASAYSTHIPGVQPIIDILTLIYPHAST